MQLSDWIATASAAFAGISALGAAAAIYFPWRKSQNQELQAQAVLSLERAFDALTAGGKEIRPPPPDRLNWLTCARHIVRYQSLKGRIRTKLHRLLCEEHEEFWRHQFYLALDSKDLLQTSYYAEVPAPQCRPQIEPRSALIIHAFAQWSEGKPDPVDSVDIDALLRDGKVLNGRVGLREYLRKHHPKFGNET
ncbi:MAG: hypothetical protein OZ935_06220 [Pseudomonadota bacterium]|jgi:hypothetical protein|nr:hypothetical protein [Pseudomonadota bacterium]